MRFDFEPQRVELRSREVGFELRLAQLQLPRALGRGQRPAANDEQQVDDWIRKEDVGERDVDPPPQRILEARMGLPDDGSFM